jgi:hypothetical protein
VKERRAALLKRVKDESQMIGRNQLFEGKANAQL